MTQLKVHSAQRWALHLRLSILIILCLLLGGTSQDIIAPKVLLYVLFICVIGAFFFKEIPASKLKKTRTSLWLFAAFVCIQILYLLPLPPNIWTMIPGRDPVVQGFIQSSQPLPWLPISLTPETSFRALFDLLPPLGIFFSVIFASSKELKLALWVIPCFAVLTVVVGVLQTSGLAPRLYFYEITNLGSPVGFFSNANHQATLLLMAFPFAIVHARSLLLRPFSPDHNHMIGSIFALVLAVGIGFGIVQNGSAAGYLLLPGIAVLSLFVIMLGKGKALNIKWVLIGTGVFLGLGLSIVLTLPDNIIRDVLGNSALESPVSRVNMYRTTIEAIQDFIPFGSGVGSFQSMYPLYETFADITNRYVPHAHSDYLEFILELGVFGFFILIGFYIWWGRGVIKVFMRAQAGKIYIKMGAVSALALMLHSLVDYPIRTIAIASLFAFCIALSVRSEGNNLPDPSRLMNI